MNGETNPVLVSEKLTKLPQRKHNSEHLEGNVHQNLQVVHLRGIFKMYTLKGYPPLLLLY